MDHDALEREWGKAVLAASAAAQNYATLERDPDADPKTVSRAAVELWRAESSKREVLLQLDDAEA